LRLFARQSLDLIWRHRLIRNHRNVDKKGFFDFFIIAWGRKKARKSAFSCSSLNGRKKKKGGVMKSQGLLPPETEPLVEAFSRDTLESCGGTKKQ